VFDGRNHVVFYNFHKLFPGIDMLNIASETPVTQTKLFPDFGKNVQPNLIYLPEMLDFEAGGFVVCSRFCSHH
jgi:hypothetical protein